MWLIVFGFGCWFALTSTRIQSQLSLLLPSDGSPAQRLLVQHLNQGSISRLILIGLTGSEPHILAQASQVLARTMRESGNFNYVHNGDASQSMVDYELLYQYRYVLSPAVQVEKFRMPALRTSLENRLQDLTAPLPSIIKSRIPSDPTGEFLEVLQSWNPTNLPKRYHGVWFSSDDRFALLAAETKVSGFDLDVQEQIQTKIRNVVRRFNQEGMFDDEIQVVSTGPAVFAVESRARIQNEAQWFSILATILVIGFLFARYRSMTLVSLSVVPLASGLLAAVIVVNVVHGFIHGITLAFGATLIGVAIDYPIHAFSHLTPQSSPTAVIRRIWPILRLGALTTAVGYSAMLLSGFPGLSQLGLFAIVGIGTAAFTTKWVLPSLIPRGVEILPFRRGLIDRIDALPKLSGVLPISMIISLGYLMWSDKPFWEKDLGNISPISQESKQLDTWLRKELGAPGVRDVMVLAASTEQEVLEQSEALRPSLDRLVHLGAIAGYDMAAQYLPSARTQRQRQAALPEQEELQKELSQAREGLPFKPDIFQGFIKEVAAAKHQQPLDSQDFHGTILRSKIHSLLFQGGGQWVGLVTLREVTERAQLHAVSSGLEWDTLDYLDLKEESNRMVDIYQNEVMRFLSYGAIAIMVLLAMVLRSPTMVLRVLFPVAGSALAVVAVLHLFNVWISLFHIASLLLVVGMGLDYALFFNREQEGEVERIQTITSVLICSVTTTMVFSLLALSQTPVLRSIGSTAALGVFCCLLFSGMFPRPPISSKL